MTTYDQAQLLGFFYLPGRKPDDVTGASGGTEEWFRKQKLGGLYSRAPVLMDKLQGLGVGGTNLYSSQITWVTDFEGKKVPTAAHQKGAQAPGGGNFLYEDGHVEWTPGNRIRVGAQLGTWACYFKVPIGE